MSLERTAGRERTATGLSGVIGNDVRRLVNLHRSFFQVDDNLRRAITERIDALFEVIGVKIAGYLEVNPHQKTADIREEIRCMVRALLQPKISISGAQAFTQNILDRAVDILRRKIPVQVDTLGPSDTNSKAEDSIPARPRGTRRR